MTRSNIREVEMAQAQASAIVEAAPSTAAKAAPARAALRTSQPADAPAGGSRCAYVLGSLLRMGCTHLGASKAACVLHPTATPTTLLLAGNPNAVAILGVLAVGAAAVAAFSSKPAEEAPAVAAASPAAAPPTAPTASDAAAPASSAGPSDSTM